MASGVESSDNHTALPELDVTKLHALPSEQQDLYLLTFTSDLARHVAALDEDGASAHQVYVQKELFKVIGLSSPAPTRVIRINLGRCFAGVFGKGDRKLLFASVNELHALINTGKSDKDVRSRHVAVHCLGMLFEAAGDSAISLSPLVIISLLRQLKSSQNHVGFRAALFTALGRVIKGVRSSADEQTVRDVWKQCRSAASGDKAHVVQASACWCAEQLFTYTRFLDNSSDFDKLQAALWKAMDSSSSTTRRHAASCLGAVLVKSYSTAPNPVTRVKKPKKTKPKPKDDEDEDDEIERADSPASQKPVTTLSLNLEDILHTLSTQYCRAASTNRLRASIAMSYIDLFNGLGSEIVETQYALIARHFLEELLGSPSVINNRYRLLLTRHLCRMILGDVVGRSLLGETAQINASKFLVTGVIKDYPQSDVKGRPEPSKEALVGALDTLTIYLGLLETASVVIGDTCREGLLQVLQHPSWTVQVHASRCMQQLVLACPQQLLPCVTTCMNSVNREVGQLTGPRRSPRKCLGFAFGLAATVSTSSSQPLYGSVDVYSRVLSQATSILKSSSSSDVKVSSIQIQVAWILIGGLMSLGPNFVKIHLSQLLLLWKNALPKPLSKDNIGQRGFLELSFLAHVRECALGALRAFLSFNGRLLTLDVSKRLATMLQNTTLFLSSLPNKKVTEDVDRHLSARIQLQDYDMMVRRRVYQCYKQLLDLSPASNHEALLQSSILSMAASSFSEPTSSSAGSLSSSIAASSGNFESIWDIGDNAAFGITGLVGELRVNHFSDDGNDEQRHWLQYRNSSAAIDRLVRSPISTSMEHDSVNVYTHQTSISSTPIYTDVVDTAIHLFAASLPHQSARVQEGVLEQISTIFASSVAQHNPAQHMAVTINVAAALYFALDVATRHNLATANAAKGPDAEKAVQELLHGFVVHSDQAVRFFGAEALGRLCKAAGNDFTTREVKHLIEVIIANREPQARAGCAMALGCIHAELGGMSVGLHLKNVLGVLTSLGTDPHPTVHFWALDALSKVADSAGLAFSGYVSGTLGTIAQLYVLDSHNEETSLLASSNLEVDLPTCTVIARCVGSIINVLGPDLQDTAKTRNMILTLTHEFQGEISAAMQIETFRCFESLSIYASGHLDFKPYVQYLQQGIMSEDPDVRDTALTGLRNAIQKGAQEVLQNADSGLEQDIWLLLHDTYGGGLARELVRDWLEQTGLDSVDSWIQRVQKVLTTSRAMPIAKSLGEPRKQGEPDLQDEEVAGFNAVSQAEKDGKSQASTGKELLRWQARCVAMDCMNEILAGVIREVASKGEHTAEVTLQPRISDVVRIAFSASTASVVELRIRGIQIIGKILQIFGRMPDPDFPEATLLEQYQAQISSALTPAFATDSSPGLASEAVGVCASFISTGIVTTVDRMGRILKLLVSALEDFSKDSESAAIGELKGLGSNAQVMVKLAIFSAWANIQIACRSQQYLGKVVKPHLGKLTPLWLSSLREYARLKFEPEVSNTSSSGSLAGGLDMIYASLNRETLLKFYQASWLQFVDAIASLIEEDSEFVFDALDDRSIAAKTNGATGEHDINYRDEPVAFFFVLFGISFEALVSSSSAQSIEHQAATLEILQAMTKIIRPSVAGLAIYQDAIFSEMMDLLDRLVLTEGIEVQTIIVEMAQSLCIGHPSARTTNQSPDREEHLSDDIDQLFELTRLIVLVVAKHVPKLSDASSSARSAISSEAIPLIILSLNALVDSASVFPTVIKSDLQACILHIFATLLNTPSCQESLVPLALPIFRRFVTSVSTTPQHESTTQVRNALARFLVILKQAQRREHETSLQCERNVLLATTLLLSAGARMIPAGDPLVSTFLDELDDCLSNPMTTKTAAGLCRSLLLLPTSPRAGDTEFALAGHLVPKLVVFVQRPAEIEGTAESRSVIAQSFAMFALQVSPDKREAAFKMTIPVLLERARAEGERVWPETSQRLLELASREQMLFKSVITCMNQEQKDFAEKVLQAGRALGSGALSKTEPKEEATGEPSIALRMNFGS